MSKRPNAFTTTLKVIYYGSTALLIGGLGSYSVFKVKSLVESNINQSKVEQNIAEFNDLHSYTGHSFELAEYRSEYLLALHGKVVKVPNEKARFAIIVYKVDENFANLANEVMQYQRIVENYKDKMFNGNVLENMYNYSVDTLKAQQLYNDLMQQLIEITSQKAFAMDIKGSDKYLSTVSAKLSNDQNLKIISVTKPKIYDETVSFEIQTLSNTNNSNEYSKLALKTFRVTQPLNKTLIHNPNLAINEYLNGKGSFELVNHENIILKDFSVIKVENLLEHSNEKELTLSK